VNGRGTRRKRRFVLDTSAVLVLHANRPGAERVHRIIHTARQGRVQVFLSFMTRMEVLYSITAAEGEAKAVEAVRLLDSMPVAWVSCEPPVLLEAARIKAGGHLSVADAWIAATARLKDAVLVHKDPEFAAVENLEQEFLGSRVR
jgi:predicted nucleic acid-binding protein